MTRYPPCLPRGAPRCPDEKQQAHHNEYHKDKDEHQRNRRFMVQLITAVAAIAGVALAFGVAIGWIAHA
jgi:hypothetical protein